VLIYRNKTTTLNISKRITRNIEMSEIFTIHDAEICEICHVFKTELEPNHYICLNCGNQEDNF